MTNLHVFPINPTNIGSLFNNNFLEIEIHIF